MLMMPLHGAGKINRLHEWWDLSNTEGPKFGYFTNASKAWLVTKEGYLSNAVAAFADTDMKVTGQGRPYLELRLHVPIFVSRFMCRLGMCIRSVKLVCHRVKIRYVYPVRACAKGLSNWFCPSVCQLSVQ